MCLWNGLTFSSIGKLGRGQNELDCLISEKGGRYISEVNNECYAIISNKTEILRNGTEMQEAKRLEIYIVDENVFSCAKFRDGRILSAIRENIISDWGEDVSTVLFKFSRNPNLCHLFVFFPLVDRILIILLLDI